MNDPVEAAAAALAHDASKAERLARLLVAKLPRDPRPQLILASALRRQGDAAAALPMLLELSRAYPMAARTRYELGLTLGLVGRHADGLVQLEAAVQLDPRLADAWQALSHAAFAAGDHARELRARAVLARLEAGGGPLGEAAEMVVLGRFDVAESRLRRHLLSQPSDAGALRLLAACYLANRAFDQADTLLRHALEIEPDFALARFDLAHSLFARQQAEAALIELAPLEAADPDNAAYRNLRAGCLALLGDEEGAEALHGELAARYPANARIAVNHGHALRTKGHRDRAIAAYRRAIALDRKSGEAWWSLANLKVGALTAEDEAAMRALAADPALGDPDRMRISYALGRRLEDSGRPEESFRWYARGAALARERASAALVDHHDHAEQVQRVFTTRFLEERSGEGVDDASPIFVVGLPRSGSTLVEQILSSHPDIEGTMELPYMGAITARLAQQGRDAWTGLTPDTIRALGEEYLARAAIHRRLGRKHFIDKMPNNFRHLGLIRLILPRARIVDVRRAPMAACFSCFKQLFAEGHEYSYDLGDLGRYYRHYLAIIRHFALVQPGAVHTLIYEDLVEATEVEVARLLDAVGVPFSPACLRFFENDRAVRTVSSEQVRQPIYRSGLDHWQVFEPWLGPLKVALGATLNNWRT